MTTDTTLPLLGAGGTVSGADLFITRQGADTVDTKITATQLQTFTLGGNSTFATANSVFVGPSSGVALTSGTGNTALGVNALESVTSGANNIAIGENAAKDVTTAGRNIAIGVNALGIATTGGYNIAIGENGFNDLTTGAFNTVIGQSSGGTLTTGFGNVLIGNNINTTTAGSDYELNIGGVITGTGIDTPATSTITFPGNVTVTGTFTGGGGGGTFAALTDVIDDIPNANMACTGVNPAVSGTNNTLFGTNAAANLAGGSGNIILTSSGGPGMSQGGAGIVGGSQNIIIGDAPTNANYSGIIAIGRGLSSDPGSGGVNIADIIVINGSADTSNIKGITFQALGAVASIDNAWIIGPLGTKQQISEGANAAMGVATLVPSTPIGSKTAASVVVSNTLVTANSRIFLTVQDVGSDNADLWAYVVARTPGVSFTIGSEDGDADYSVAWEIKEPA